MWDGALYSTTSSLSLAYLVCLKMFYSPYLSIRQRTTNGLKLGMHLSMTTFQSEREKELAFESVVDVWGLLEFQLAAKPLWEME